jgi:hypothetical protein
MDSPAEDMIQKKFHAADDDWLETAEKQQPFLGETDGERREAKARSLGARGQRQPAIPRIAAASPPRRHRRRWR